MASENTAGKVQEFFPSTSPEGMPSDTTSMPCPAPLDSNEVKSVAAMTKKARLSTTSSTGAIFERSSEAMSNDTASESSPDRCGTPETPPEDTVIGDDDGEYMTFPVIPPNITSLHADEETRCELSWLPYDHHAQDKADEFTEPAVVSSLHAAWAWVTSCMTNSERVAFEIGNYKTSGSEPKSMPLQVWCAPSQSVRDYLQLVRARTGAEGIFETNSDCTRRHVPKLTTLITVEMDNEITADSNTTDNDVLSRANYALVLHIRLLGTRLQAKATSDSRVIETWLVPKLLKDLEFLMQQLHGAEPETRLSDVDVTSPDDMEQIWRCNGSLPVAIERCMHDIFEDQVHSQPFHLAIDAWDGQLTYTELDELSERLAGSLLELGVGPEVVVPLCFEKSIWMPVAMIGVLKAGGAFTLLDPSFPEQRLRGVINKVNAVVMLSSPSNRALCSRLLNTVIQVDSESVKSLSPYPNRPRNLQASSTAMFVVFTSGSTGLPKGAILTHTNYSSALTHQLQRLGFTKESRTFDFASYAFDVSIHNVFATLASGACLCIPSDEDRRNDISKVMKDMRVTIAHLTPSVARLIEPESVPFLETMIFTGEPLSVDDATRWWGKVNVVNEYGPAECTINTINSHASSPEVATNIGSPVGVSGWIVHPENHESLVPVGCTGELVVEGPLVGHGYIGDPVRTAASFIEDPNWLLRGGPGYTGRRGRLYKTGDLVRYCEDGSLSFVGRKDVQVKIRGQRVDLGEVEHWTQVFIPEADQVVAEVVVPQAISSASTLAVFIQSQKAAGSAVDAVNIRAVPDDVQAKLAQYLPSYVIPTVFFWMKTLPLTPTGKMDRKKLREIGSSFSTEEFANARAVRRHGRKRQPSSEMEETLREIWARVLDISSESIGLEDNFFRLGGDSIGSMRAVADARRLGIQVSVADVFRHSTLYDLARSRSRSLASLLEHIPAFGLLSSNFDRPSFFKSISAQYALDPATIQDAYPCTRLQEGLMFLTSKRSGDYIEQSVLELAPDLSMDSLRDAWEQAVKAMPILRTRIVHHNDLGLLQLILDKKADWAEAKGLEEHLAADRKRSMNLGDALSRFALVKDESDKYKWLVWTIHHAIYDGWSIRLVTDAVANAYGGQKIQEGPQFQTFIRYVQDQDQRAAAGYWLENMEGFDTPPFPPLAPSINQPVADMSVEHNIPHPKNGNGRITTSMLIRAAWALVIGRMSNSNDVVFGSTVHGRNAAITDIDQIVAPTIATVPVRIKFCSTQNARSYLETVQQEAADMMLFEQTGLQKIATASAACQRACQFQTHVVIQPDDRVQDKGPLGRWRSDTQEEWFSTYALTVEIWLGSNDIIVAAMFDSRTIQPWVVSGMLQRLGWTMHQLDHAATSTTLGDIDMSSAQDLEQIWQWNEKFPERVDRRIHDLLADQIQARPGSTAICAWDGQLTYRQLDELSTKLSSRLLQLGVGLSNDMVPLCFEKSMWTAVAILGVLKAGAGFILLDPSLPAQRMETIVAQVSSTAIVTCPSMEMKCSLLVDKTVAISWEFFAGLVGQVSREPPPICPSSIAYAIFTSGSTGTPKGVMITHSNVVSAQHHQLKLMGHTPGSRLFDFCSYSFDVSISNIISMLACGGCLCVPSENDRKVDLEKSILSLGANALDLTPSTLQLLSPERLTATHLLTLGGEPLRPSDIEKWCGRVRICNAYGPSECTPTATINVNPIEPHSATHIGKGAGVVTWIVDPDDPDELLPPGCTGELLLEGPIVGRGYLGDPAKTALAFIEDPRWLLRGSPLRPGRHGRLYKTGDLVKYNQDGSLTFVGRKDTQVKIRGQRIEPGEIEAVLRSHESVSEAIVVLQRPENEESWLAGFITIRDNDEISPRGDLAAGDTPKSLQEEQKVQGWEEEFDGETYVSIDHIEAKSIGRDFIGWTSMYDGGEINKSEMNEWLDDTIKSILNGGAAGHVLEIGCGSGMMLFNLAKHGLESYLGVDPATRAVDFTARAAKSIPGLAEKVTVFKGTAEDIMDLDMPVSPNLVIMNSVVQYFPSQEYLFKIIEYLADMGSVETIFLGDIRSFALQKEFMAKRALHIGAEDVSREGFSQILDNLRGGEPELLLDPGFFTGLPGRLSGVKHVEILPKTMKATNELSSYRYAAVLHVNLPRQEAQYEPVQDMRGVCWIDYVSNRLTRQSVLSLLGGAPMVALSNIPYSKTIYEREIVSALEAETYENASQGGAWLARALQVSRSHSSLCAFDLDELARQAGYRAEVSWARQHSQGGGLDAVFYRSQNYTSPRRTLFRFPTDHEGRAYHLLSSKPLGPHRESKICKELELMVRSQLPSYMMPHSLQILHTLPVNRNGKIDRRMLSERGMQKRVATGTRRTPTTASERKLQQIWSTVLNMEADSIGLDDGFIQLGGNSLGAMKIINMAREAGIRLEVADMFRHSTTSIAHLVGTTTEESFKMKSAPLAPASDRLMSEISRHDLSIAAAQAEAATCPCTVEVQDSRDKQLTVALTGANGFIGTQILRQLLENGRVGRVIAIVRGASARQARQRAIDAAKKARWWTELHGSMLEVWSGDLAQKKLGLDEESWRAIADGAVDVFIHNGASVHFMKSYSALEAANVESTAQVLRTAAENTRMKVVYVSSARCCDPGVEVEEDVAKALADSPNGYNETKFVAEALVRRAAARSPETRDQFAVVSPGLVVGTPTEGVANADDWVWRMAAACIRVGVFNGEESDRWVPMADAAATASIIIDAALSRSSGIVTQVKGGMTMGEFWATLRTAGYTLRNEDQNKWIAAIRKDAEDHRETHPLGALTEMLESLGGTAKSQWAESWKTGGISSLTRLKVALVKNAEFLSNVSFLPLPASNVNSMERQETMYAFTRSRG